MDEVDKLRLPLFTQFLVFFPHVTLPFSSQFRISENFAKAILLRPEESNNATIPILI